MNYLLFNNNILMSDGKNLRRIAHDDGVADILNIVDQAKICVLEVEVMIASSVESPIEKKDSILVHKFKESYSQESYLIQDERIDHNLFQVIAIKEQRLRQIYELVPPSKVLTLIPYAIALRAFLHKTLDSKQTIVFVDEQKAERFITVFHGLQFSRTRIVNEGEDILPEIKRSHIDFIKKNGGYLNGEIDFVILVNQKELFGELMENKENIPVRFFDFACPALEGLRDINTSIRYRLPEEDLKQRKQMELRKKFHSSLTIFALMTVALIFFIFNKIELSMADNKHMSVQEIHDHLKQIMGRLDVETYREDLKRHKTINYGMSYLSMLDIIPSSYTINDFKYYKKDKWEVEMTLFTDDEGIFDTIPRTKMLKDVQIKDVFVNNQPGKHLKVVL